MTVEPIRWGILGAANFALQHMGRAIHAAEGAELVALATSSAEKALPFKAFCPGLKVHDSYEALLADPGIDAVYVPLPNHLHVEWTLKAMEAGKHVLTEKPIAMRAGEIDALIAKRDETGLHATEAYMIVHHPQWQRAKAMLADGAIGELVHVDGVFTYYNPDMGNIRNDASKGGGGIPDIGVYTYGSTRWMLGEEPEEITHADLDFEAGVDVVARVAARFPSCTAHWINSMRMHPWQHMSFHGTEGVIRLTAPFNANVFDQAEVELHQQDMGRRVERFPGVNQYVLQVENFGRTVREGAAYPWSLEDAKGTQALIDAVYAKGGRG
ncbi:Gfo/Idh/MocA family protein [Oceanicola sp. 502str15]|uniref:Gfo/Idh/MocA family protein n=1 Tax=Oceanicola sp. 502str15 TaxID=2696061 RepID=UPI0020949645|nr:Gfo/Idh/MocA family oxidoreductase [Oceanicola sp. 502str15]MCO6382777.1 Gfo/Idh/MocA family oxidoreductase [Oceanicola sp. 502str15]